MSTWGDSASILGVAHTRRALSDSSWHPWLEDPLMPHARVQLSDPGDRAHFS